MIEPIRMQKNEQRENNFIVFFIEICTKSNKKMSSVKKDIHKLTNKLKLKETE